MAGIGKKPGLHLVGTPQMIGLFFNLRIQRHNAAVGVFELARQRHQFVLPRSQFGKGLQQFPVLQLGFRNAISQRTGG